MVNERILIIGVLIAAFFIFPTSVNAVDCNLSSVYNYAISQGMSPNADFVENSTLKQSGKDIFYAYYTEWNANHTYLEKKWTFYVVCDSGIVFNHYPSFKEVYTEVTLKIDSTLYQAMKSAAENEEIPIMLFSPANVSKDVARNDLLNAGMSIAVEYPMSDGHTSFSGSATKSEISSVSNISWVTEIDYNSRSNVGFAGNIVGVGSKDAGFNIYEWSDSTKLWVASIAVVVLIAVVLLATYFYKRKRK